MPLVKIHLGTQYKYSSDVTCIQILHSYYRSLLEMTVYLTIRNFQNSIRLMIRQSGIKMRHHRVS